MSSSLAKLFSRPEAQQSSLNQHCRKTVDTLQGSKSPTKSVVEPFGLELGVILHAFQLLVLILKPRQGTCNSREVGGHSVRQLPSINQIGIDITRSKRHWTVSTVVTEKISPSAAF